MTDLRRVLAAVDASDWTGPVLAAALDLRRAFGADLTVLHAQLLLPPPYFTERAVAALAQMLESQRLAAEAWLRQTAAGHLGDAPFATRLVEAAPAEAILRTARQVEADLVVLGTHGRTGLQRLLLGSVAERVLRECDRPVLAVRPGPHGRPPWAGGPRRILCPVNFRDVSRRALDWAETLAARFGAELLLVTAVEDGQRARAERELAAWCNRASGACNARALVRQGEAAAQILAAARDEAADLIVLGAEHRPLLAATVIGTTSVRVVRHAQAPVLTVTRGPGAVAA